MARRATFLVFTVLLVACGAQRPALRLPEVSPARDEPALRAAADAYYAATDAAGLRAAVARAKAAGADAATHHEIAADLARLEGRPDDEFEHLLAALLDPVDDAAILHLHQLEALSWTLDQRARAEDLYHALVEQHPDAAVRGLAATFLAASLHLRGDVAGRDAALAATGLRLPWAVIGTWDNDQGKGFDAEQPPERSVDLAATYRGRLVDVGWRTAYPVDPRGHVDLAAVLEPDRWQVAYAAAAVEVPEAGPYELRLSTSDPVKVWVNDALVLAERRVAAWLPEGFVVPVSLRAGVNRIVVKSAQEEGGWYLAGRLTRPGGGSPSEARVVAAGAPYAAEGPASATLAAAALLAARIAALPEDGARRAFHDALWAELTGLRVPAVERADAFLGAHPGSLPGRYRLAAAAWNNQERDRTADLLGDLVRDAGADLVYFPLQQARFWRQQSLDQKARDLLLTLREKHPDRPEVWLRLADVFDSEGWHEDRCATLEEADRRWPRWPAVRLELAACLQSLRFEDRAAAIYREVLEAMPNSQTALTALQGIHQGDADFAGALDLAERLAAAWPHLLSAWERIGETRRRMGDAPGAEGALRRLVDHAPTDPVGYARLAELAYQGGRRDDAVALWQRALERDPENDKLANRLAFLAPDERGPWTADVPGEQALEQIIAGRERLQVAPGANVVYLLDDEVTELKPDGSTINVITQVAYAANDAGRDSLTQQTMRGGGRARLLHAYAVGPDGRRLEAASIRGREVRFRQLKVGSIVVLQYRLDSPPDGYLAAHLARQWWFQGNGVQTVTGRWVLWAPKGTPLNESVVGDVRREHREEGGRLRVAWSVAGTPPLVAEPAMPTVHELMAHVLVSTVPDWDTFLKWEEALLQDVFRDGPELSALARKLFEGAATKQEKVERVHAYLIDEIRYQQDYERPIAGVKPHAAPVVLERHYGDCKDKAVLFITLARLAGIDVHFALVRTRDAGPVWRDVPMQQFNHAIVYVPAQEGLPEGRFYDPTVDALDVDVLRQDDQGTWSVVYDPRSGAHAWRQIPFQQPDIDYSRIDSVLRLSADGSAEGASEVTGHGGTGSTLRRSARNAEQFAQFLQTQLAGTYPGVRVEASEPVQVTDIRQPARVRARFRAPAVSRREGETLRLRVPIGWSPQNLFSLAKRRFPLLLGVPRTFHWRVEMAPPPGATVARLPDAGEVVGPCLALARKVTPSEGKVVVEQSVRILCERIDPADYAEHRAVAERMSRLLDSELVLGLPGTPDRQARR